MTKSVVIPLTAKTSAFYNLATTALRTCRASEPESEIVALVNNTPDGARLKQLKLECEALEIGYDYIPGPFNMNRFFNIGTGKTHGDYTAYCNQDLIFYPGWLTKIIELWEQNPDFFALTSYSLGFNNYPCELKVISNEPKIWTTHNPASGLIVYKRSSGYVFDETFSWWEQDADFYYYLQRNGLKAGCCLNARVDHLWHGVYDNHSPEMIEDMGKANVNLKKKWNLP